MDRQHVLVIEDDLLSQVVTSLLSQVKDWDIVSFALRDETELVEEIERIRPAVVVLSTATKLTDPDGLICLLEERLDVRVVVVSVEDNTVRVLDRRQVVITRGQDLAAIIRSWIRA